MHRQFWIALLGALQAVAFPQKKHTGDEGDKGEIIPGHHIAIVDTKHGLSNLLTSLRQDDSKSKVDVKHHFNIGDFQGVAVQANSEADVKKLDGVVHVEPDRKVQLVTARRSNGGSSKSDALKESKLAANDRQDDLQEKKVGGKKYIVQRNAPYGLARLSHKQPHQTTYLYREHAGDGITAYILDTGIYPDHNQYKGRVRLGPNVLDPNGPVTDDHGHGTCMAGQIGGIDYGVAKKTHLVSVKVCDSKGEGLISAFIAGVNWAVQDIQEKGNVEKSVINMSIGTSDNSDALNAATRAAVDADIFVAVASGNDDVDARTASPRNEPAVCTVGATDADDKRDPESNWGHLVDIHAPGVEIMSAGMEGPDEIAYWTGSSQANAYVCGLAAYLISTEGYSKPARLRKRMQYLATKDVVSDPKHSPNLLAANGRW